MGKGLRLRLVGVLLGLAGAVTGCTPAGAASTAAAAAGATTATGLLDLGRIGRLGLESAGGVATGPALGNLTGVPFQGCIYVVELGPPRVDTPGTGGGAPLPAQDGPLPGISI